MSLVRRPPQIVCAISAAKTYFTRCFAGALLETPGDHNNTYDDDDHDDCGGRATPRSNNQKIVPRRARQKESTTSHHVPNPIMALRDVCSALHICGWHTISHLNVRPRRGGRVTTYICIVERCLDTRRTLMVVVVDRRARQSFMMNGATKSKCHSTIIWTNSFARVRRVYMQI